jgi:hypothetical protein
LFVKSNLGRAGWTGTEDGSNFVPATGGGHNVEPSAKAGTRRVGSRPLRSEFMENKMANNRLTKPFSPNPKKGEAATLDGHVKWH